MDVKATPKTLLKFDQVAKTYGEATPHPVAAIENLSFSVGVGECVAIIGPSGCGKTTILRIAAGLDTLTNGTVLYDAHAIQGPDRRRGLVFQSYNVFPWLTVRRNIAFGLNDRDSVDAVGKIQKWLELTGLTAFADAYPKTLSGGMCQRLALARTLIVEPELLLLDEPFGALDEPTRISMRELLFTAVGETRCSVLFVTHGIREAIHVADRIMLLSSRPGQILAEFQPTKPRPRDSDFEKSDDFHCLHKRILDMFPTGLIQ